MTTKRAGKRGGKRLVNAGYRVTWLTGQRCQEDFNTIAEAEDQRRYLRGFSELTPIWIYRVWLEPMPTKRGKGRNER